MALGGSLSALRFGLGLLLATTSTARSKRSHASGSKSGLSDAFPFALSFREDAMPTTIIEFQRGTHRLFSSVLQTSAFLQGMFLGWKILIGHSTNLRPGDHIRVAAGLLSKQVCFLAHGPLQSLTLDRMPESIIVVTEDTEHTSGGVTTGGMSGLFQAVFETEFQVFFANYSEWIRLHVTTDYHNWPPVWNFARVVRNAISHGGAINISISRCTQGHMARDRIRSHETRSQNIRRHLPRRHVLPDA